MKRRQLTPEQALDRLETLCARAEQCTGDLCRKLAGWGIHPGDADAIIAQLKKGRWVDDERFARAYCRDKYRFNRWGRAKVKMGLISKRVAMDVIAVAMEEIDDEVYRANLESLLKSKIKVMGHDVAATYEGRTKLFRYGASRGYEPSLVAQVLRTDEIWSGDEPLGLWWSDLVGMFYPNVCQVCGTTLVRGERVMCLDCRVKLPRTMTHRAHGPDPIQSRLASTAVKIERIAAYFHYYSGDTYAGLIHQAKYNHRPRLARRLGEDFARELMPDNFFDGIDLIVPVPLHRSKLRRRGYNQALEIARGVSAVTGVPVDEPLVSIRSHGSQTRLGAFGRWVNARDTYDAPGATSLTAGHILIVDDVLTTGATALACAEAIHRHCPTALISVLTLAATHLR